MLEMLKGRLHFFSPLLYVINPLYLFRSEKRCPVRIMLPEFIGNPAHLFCKGMNISLLPERNRKGQQYPGNRGMNSRLEKEIPDNDAACKVKVLGKEIFQVQEDKQGHGYSSPYKLHPVN